MFKGKKIRILLMTLVISLFTVQYAHAATYTVVSGDTLFSIGRLFNTSASSIMSSNNLLSTIIHPGQVLRIQGGTYVVKSGDTLFSIARMHSISLDALRRANNKWDDRIFVGQVLNIPGSTTSAQTSTASVQAVSSVIPHTQSELDLLARLIRAEAENQPYTAKVAVGAVVVNRVRSSLFANTISGVIYERINGHYQFTPVVNGHINKQATQEEIRAAQEALNGADPTKGALFFFDDSTTNTWLWSRSIALRVDRMVFAY
jgi:N-acetylmuramoyl-L-alanine amidase